MTRVNLNKWRPFEARTQMSDQEQKQAIAEEEEDIEYEELSYLPSFWSAVVKPGEPVVCEYPEECILTLTNACLDTLPEDGSAVRLVADVESLKFPLEETIKEVEDEDIQKSTVLLSSLIPNVKEQQQLNCVFTMYDNVTLSVKGTVPIHVSGTLSIDDNEYDYEEEEEDGNDITPVDADKLTVEEISEKLKECAAQEEAQEGNEEKKE